MSDIEFADPEVIRSRVEAGTLDAPEPRWPAVVAGAAFGLLYLALPPSLSIGPRWLEPVVVFVLLALNQGSHHLGWAKWNHSLGYVMSGALTLFMVISLVLLVVGLPEHKETPVKLLISALALWVGNVLVFALWYWRLDAGGPNGRDVRAGHPHGAFLFPQMTTDGREAWDGLDGALWSPQFVDYLFLAFNTSTAFSPTDAPVLSRWAKAMCITQSTISLMVVALLAARAVNIL